MAKKTRNHNGDIVYATPVTNKQAKGGIFLYLIVIGIALAAAITGFDFGFLIYLVPIYLVALIGAAIYYLIK